MAVLPTKFVRGVASADDDWRRASSGKKRPTAAAVVLDLVEALERTWTTDAHCVGYLVLEDGTPLPKQPRVNKPGLEVVESWGFEVVTSTFIADIDNPQHAAWSSDDEASAGVARIRELVPTAGVYATKHGARIVQPLTRPIPVSESEPVVLAWLMSLLELGIQADLACKDWTRLMRMPHVRRDGRPYRSPAISLDGMRPIEPPPPLLLEEPKRPRKASPAKPRPAAQPAPSSLQDTPLVKAFAAAGWLGSTLPGGKIVAYCPWQSGHSTGQAFDSSTIIFGATARQPRGWWHCSHASCLVRTQADVIAALPPHARKLLEPEDPAARALEETSRELVDAIRHAPDGVSLVEAQCGLGKTRAAREIAIERAAKQHKTGQSTRAPLHSKTALSLPTNKLADEQVEFFRAAGVPVKRLRGVLSVLGPDGKPACRFAEAARYLANGGQSVPWELCEGRGRMKCDFADECPAYGGVDGPKDARIIVGPHELAGQLSSEAGSTGLLVIDEPPPVVESHVLASSDLAVASSQLGQFESRYAVAMRPALEAVTRWLEEGGDDEVGSLARALDGRVDDDLLTDAFMATGEVDALSCVRAALEEGHKTIAPPLRDGVAWGCRWNTAYAHVVGAASRVLLLLYRALTSDHVVARVESRGGNGERVIVLVAPNEDFHRVLRREGATVVTDAGASLLQPILTKLLGYEPPLSVFSAPDGAPIERTMLRMRATRAAWMPRGRLRVSSTLVDAVERMVEWVLRDPTTTRVGIVTMRTLRLALEAACGLDVADEWREAGQSLEVLDDARRVLGPILARLPQRPDFGHYGAIRGLDHWRGHDAVITLGDPWLQLSDVQHECDWLGIDDWERRCEELCKADLEQAQGRLRTVHRKRPGRALHVGHVMPGRWPLDVAIEDLKAGGRPQNRGGLPDDFAELVRACGGVAGLARELGVGRATMNRYIAGKRGVPADVVERLDDVRRRVLGGSDPGVGVSETLIRDLINKGFGDTLVPLTPRPAIRVSETLSAEPAEPPSEPLPPPAELERLVHRAGGLRALARKLAVPYPSLRRYLAGERQPPADVVSALWRMVPAGRAQGAPERALRGGNRMFHHEEAI